jgi:hypothetical protein
VPVCRSGEDSRLARETGWRILAFILATCCSHPYTSLSFPTTGTA